MRPFYADSSLSLSQHAEAVFIAQPTPKLAALKVAEYRAKVAEAGRDPRSVKVIPGLTVFLGKTEEEATANFAYWRSHGDGESALAFAASATGTDWANWGEDEELTPAPGTGGFAYLENWKRMVPGIGEYASHRYRRGH